MPTDVMHKKYKAAIFGLLCAVAVGVTSISLYVRHHTVAVLSPAGTIAGQQRTLILVATLLSLLVIVPVFILTFSIAWRYRASNTRAHHAPNWDHHPVLEAVWWAIPCAIILVLATITVKSSRDLDPFKPLNTTAKPMTIQVVALQWKWLFIYPEQHIATVNYVQFPQDTPVNFVITADAPMNSFWIPQLGGQVYAMAGMQTELHLMADKTGTYAGSSANLSGEGFAGMRFTAESNTAADFAAWVKNVRHFRNNLDAAAYHTLARPSKDQPVGYYGTVDEALYDTILMKYTTPGTTHMNDGMGHE